MRLTRLVSVADLSDSDLAALFERAAAFATGTPVPHVLAGRTVATVFFEPSTRTRLSFDVAAQPLGSHVVAFEKASSSDVKGESLLDTVRNLEALGVSLFVVRHPLSGAADFVARHVTARVVNAGDGAHQHPTQGLLDAFTLWRAWGTLAHKTIVIAGDIVHSRVARSSASLFRRLGAQVVLSGPPSLVPPEAETLGRRELDFDKALEDADAVMMLRYQTERHLDAATLSGELTQGWGLTETRARKLKPAALVMHPGPINRGVEIQNAVADGPQSVILEQARNGVFMRQAVLEALA